MAAPIKIRPSYASDCTFLGRLTQAVEKDNRITLETKKKALMLLGNLRIVLVDADKEVYAEQDKLAANGK